jgi:hypothetical protein
MALNPVPAVVFAVTWATMIALVTTSTVTIVEIPSCHGWDILTGCNDTKSLLLSAAVLGTIPGAPDAINLFLAIIGLACRGTVIWSIIEIVRGT